MKRVVSVLHARRQARARLSLYVTEEPSSAPARRSRICPRGTELISVVGEESYRILRRSEGASERLFAEVRPIW